MCNNNHSTDKPWPNLLQKSSSFEQKHQHPTQHWLHQCWIHTFMCKSNNLGLQNHQLWPIPLHKVILMGVHKMYPFDWVTFYLPTECKITKLHMNADFRGYNPRSFQFVRQPETAWDLCHFLFEVKKTFMGSFVKLWPLPWPGGRWYRHRSQTRVSIAAFW